MARLSQLLACLMSSAALVCICAAASALVAAPARGDVMDVAPGGAVTVYDAPSVFSDSGVRRISVRGSAAPYTSSFIRPGDIVGNTIASAAARYFLDPDLLRGLAWRESRFRHDAVSAKGAVGVMQLMEGTARDLGVNRYDLTQNILGGAAYLKQMMDRYGGNRSLALAAYNAGPMAVDRYRGIPPFPETETYVKDITGVVSASTRPPFVISINP